MGNVIRGGAEELHLSNGGTEVLVEVLMLAASTLAAREWEFRFAALLALQDQHVMGRGAVGFDLADIDWGGHPAERTGNRDAVLRVADLALARHRWDELGYDPPRTPEYLRRFRSMVAKFDLATPVNDPPEFPRPGDVLLAGCPRHRLLTPLPWYPACVRCGAEPRDGRH
ncbi:hypothetical protein [Marinactinospora rubrisoli]|uniref:Uncharacterized protein n=1 Tax=Marinactinospora rubrisoli TaxID=2715399 RepID=A0ABW2KDC7_9ACTN